MQEALLRGYEVWAGVRATSSRENLQDKRIHFIDLHYEDRGLLTRQLKDFAARQGASGLLRSWRGYSGSRGIRCWYGMPPLRRVPPSYPTKPVPPRRSNWSAACRTPPPPRMPPGPHTRRACCVRR